MRVYVGWVLIFILLIGVLGIIAPALVSAKDTSAVIAGISILVLLPILIYVIWDRIIKSITKKE